MIKYLIQKEFLQIRRNAFLPRLIIAFPIVIMCVMPWVMNQEVKNIRVSVVDNDRSMLSQRLVHRIEQSNFLLFAGEQPTYQAALKEIEQSRSDMILVIPRGMSRDLTLGKKPQLLIAANAVNSAKGGIGSSYLAQIVSANLSPLTIHQSPIPTLQSPILNPPSSLFLYNKNLNYKVFIRPCLQ